MRSCTGAHTHRAMSPDIPPWGFLSRTAMALMVHTHTHTHCLYKNVCAFGLDCDHTTGMGRHPLGWKNGAFSTIHKTGTGGQLSLVGWLSKVTSLRVSARLLGPSLSPLKPIWVLIWVHTSVYVCRYYWMNNVEIHPHIYSFFNMNISVFIDKT